MVKFDVQSPNSQLTNVDVLTFRMKTTTDEGLVFYAAGDQGDHISLELSQGRLYFDVNLGKRKTKYKIFQLIQQSTE